MTVPVPTMTGMGPSPIADKRQALRDLLVADIRAGRCPAGTAMPSEWDLVNRFSVSRTTVRGALAMLAAEGLVVRHQGQPTLVHAEAERRLAGQQEQATRIAIILGESKVANPVFAGILASFHAHLPPRLRPAVYFHGFVKPALYAGASVAVIDGSFDAAAIAAVRERIPRLVVLNRQLRDLPCACTDNRAGGAIMAEHALERGHRHIGVLHFGDHDTEEEFVLRLRGIRSACAKAGATLTEVGLRLKRQFEFTPHQAVEQLLRQAPDTTVILCVSDQLALHVLESLSERAIAVPERMAVIGFDDLPNSRFIEPPLTTVRQPVEEIGEALAAGVTALSEGRPAGLGRAIRPQLVPRASCPPLRS